MVKKYITVSSNAKNEPELKLWLSCKIPIELEIEPNYVSMRPDKNGMIKQTLTVTTQKKDLQILEFTFNEYGRSELKAEPAWQTSLPLRFTTKLTKIDTVTAEGYLKYHLDISLMIKDNATAINGSIKVITNHPKKQEVALSGVILEQEK